MLEKNINSSSVSGRLSDRSKIVLLSAEGRENKEIAQRLDIPPNKAGLWRDRFAEGGMKSISKDKPKGANHGGKAMSLPYHPETGTIVLCDFSGIKPEMIKRRPAVIISPRLRGRDSLCTVVPLSTTPPRQVMPYHYKIYTLPPLPKPYNSESHWVKADMLATVSFNRLALPFI